MPTITQEQSQFMEALEDIQRSIELISQLLQKHQADIEGLSRELLIIKNQNGGKTK